MQRVTILVCGERLRGDDAVGIAIVALLPEATAHLVEVHEVGGLMPDDVSDAPGPVVIVDAVAGPTPGEVVDLPLAALTADAAHAPTTRSSHVLPIATTISIAGHLRGVPDGRFIGIAGARFEHGRGLSPAVRAAIPEATARLNHWVRVLAHGRRVSTCA